MAAAPARAASHRARQPDARHGTSGESARRPADQQRRSRFRHARQSRPPNYRATRPPGLPIESSTLTRTWTARRRVFPAARVATRARTSDPYSSGLRSLAGSRTFVTGAIGPRRPSTCRPRTRYRSNGSAVETVSITSRTPPSPGQMQPPHHHQSLARAPRSPAHQSPLVVLRSLATDRGRRCYPATDPAHVFGQQSMRPRVECRLPLASTSVVGPGQRRAGGRLSVRAHGELPSTISSRRPRPRRPVVRSPDGPVVNLLRGTHRPAGRTRGAESRQGTPSFFPDPWPKTKTTSGTVRPTSWRSWQAIDGGGGCIWPRTGREYAD